MRLSYDPETDALYIELVERPSVDSWEVAPDTVVHFDADGNVVGLDTHAAARACGGFPCSRLPPLERQPTNAFYVSEESVIRRHRQVFGERDRGDGEVWPIPGYALLLQQGSRPPERRPRILGERPNLYALQDRIDTR